MFLWPAFLGDVRDICLHACICFTCTQKPILCWLVRCSGNATPSLTEEPCLPHKDSENTLLLYNSD